MSLQINDTSLGIEVQGAIVKIAYYTVNRTGYSIDTGLPIFSANLYLEYSNETEVYSRTDISIDNLYEKDLDLVTFYARMKERAEFQEAEDKIPVYVAPAIMEEVILPPMEEIQDELSETVEE